jgi:16S rRNA (cytosine967-C5)-methyltransferase
VPRPLPETVLKQSHSLAQSFAAAGEVIGRVLSGSGLNASLGELKSAAVPAALVAAAQDLSYGALRAYGVVDALLERLLEKPLPDAALRGLLLAALSELMARPEAAHAVVHQAVEAAARLGRPRAKGLVNAVLRNYQRRAAALMADIEAVESGRFRHPQWWIDLLKAAYAEEWPDILRAGNQHPPMTLRVNIRRSSVEAYLAKLRDAGIAARPLAREAVRLEVPRRVDALPGFASGEVSVQDAGAQWAARLLDVGSGMRVLDACAAPGGKTGHILELAECDLVAADIDRTRTERIAQNLARLGLSARVLVADCREPERCLGSERFDRILLDAPCSASGVARRHPDSKWLRRPEDIPAFARTQASMLDALWRMLVPGGKLLYATCSVFPAENGDQVTGFLARHADAAAVALPGLRAGQIVPGPDSDGFFYALLQKRQP